MSIVRIKPQGALTCADLRRLADAVELENHSESYDSDERIIHDRDILPDILRGLATEVEERAGPAGNLDVFMGLVARDAPTYLDTYNRVSEKISDAGWGILQPVEPGDQID